MSFDNLRFRAFRSCFGHFSCFRVIFGFFGSVLVVFGHFWSFWVIFGRFWSFWVVFGHFDSFLVILVIPCQFLVSFPSFFEHFRVISRHFRPPFPNALHLNRTSRRFFKLKTDQTPAANKYQKDNTELTEYEPAYKPFMSAVKRFQEPMTDPKLTPGPGSYSIHQVRCNRKIVILTSHSVVAWSSSGHLESNVEHV